MAKKNSKLGTMGRGFAQMTRILDYCEVKLAEMERQYNSGIYDPIAVKADQLGSAVDWVSVHYDPMSDSILDFTERLIKGWGVDAANVRKSFKFKATEGDLIHLAHTNPHRDDIEFRLPFPECALVYQNPSFSTVSDETGGQRDIAEMVLFMEGRILDEKRPEHSISGKKDWYEDSGIKFGDEFISVTCGFLIGGLRDLFLIPAEFHFTANVPVNEVNYTSGCPAGTPDSLKKQMMGYGRCVYIGMMMWMMALNSPQVKHDVRQGLKPGVIHTPRRKERVFYEHTLLTINPQEPVELKDPLGSHSKHRLHPVRGFWRRYKSGKVTWVKPHWRGDKELGVVTHDYEITTE